MDLRTSIPWWLRIGAKIALSRTPISYSLWRRLGLFRHGEMNDPIRALKAFQAHFERAAARHRINPGFTCLELGPGDSLLSGVVARAFGAKRVLLVDGGSYAVQDIEPYKRMASVLEKIGRPVPEVAECATLEQICDACRVTYLTKGTASFDAIDSGSVDYAWSQVVLEHIRRDEFPVMLAQLRRVTALNGVGSHSIDLRDHLGGGLNSLRFSAPLWESRFMSSSGFYTNRIRYREMLNLFHVAGFTSEVLKTVMWEKVPVEPRKLAMPFSRWPEEDLRIAEFEVLLRPAPTGA
jgi:hypothetical protein